MSRHRPFYADVQSHYDVSDDFFGLFLDPSRTYSCAYWKEPGYTLEQAQIAKNDLALGKCALEPGMTLLDIGCGWGSMMLRAMDAFQVNVVGLTLSRNQYDFVTNLLSQRAGGAGHGEVLLAGWEEFEGKVDRIVSIGAFEHFRAERYADFFDFAYRAMPADGVMLLHTIVGFGRDELRENGIRFTHEYLEFIRFIRETIFPGGQLPRPWGRNPPGVRECAEAVGFTVTQIQALPSHYARTLDQWAAALTAHNDEAVAIAGQDTVDNYLRYLTGSAEYFRTGHIDVMQFTCAKTSPAPPHP